MFCNKAADNKFPRKFLTEGNSEKKSRTGPGTYNLMQRQGARSRTKSKRAISLENFTGSRSRRQEPKNERRNEMPL
jgi:hypothetical protein